MGLGAMVVIVLARIISIIRQPEYVLKNPIFCIIIGETILATAAKKYPSFPILISNESFE